MLDNSLRIGHLIMAGNSIGNDQDIPNRALIALKDADLVVFEEDRPARRSLKQAKIHRSYLKFSEHFETTTLELITETLKANKTVCYMSDQGMPTIADPGRDIVKIAHQLRSRITVIPGPCSVSAALAACPFISNGYIFLGFLPRDRPSRDNLLKRNSESSLPLVMMDTPYRLEALLDSCKEIFGTQHTGVLALDITGEYENYIFDSLDKLCEIASQLNEKLNFILILSPRQNTAHSLAVRPLKKGDFR
jgi:16S rRNA (cytidine1402-2'-O)-methyltransferase